MEFPATFGNGITVESARSPQWGNAEHTVINMIATFKHYGGELPFSATPNDNEPHGRALFLAAENGEFGDILEYVVPPITKEDYQREFDALWPDVLLGMADADEIARAKWLRAKIKELS